MASTSPLYQQIQQHLLDKITSGEWPAHHQIPPEEQLARDFQVSRMTANKAIRDLVQKGYLTRQSGLGTFVTDAIRLCNQPSTHSTHTHKASQDGTGNAQAHDA